MDGTRLFVSKDNQEYMKSRPMRACHLTMLGFMHTIKDFDF